ncbi:MAG: acetyltransferase [Candidatus Melainabacteria bacterium HGW-Melainabacteria-1]|nr:MAG: acetyltransferase [Candidatus Melainabacteria bacterium HGW-Melainabacteria-1]
MKQPQRFRQVLTLVTSLVLLASCQSPRQALPAPAALRAQSVTPVADLSPAQTGFERFEVLRGVSGKIWPKMELLRTPGLPVERMHDRGRQRDADVLSCFGTDLPPSSDVCLHDAGEPAQRSSAVPVLLIHGANVNATSNWALPPYNNDKPGLMQHLRAQGHRVFAVTFANKHGDNFIWVNQIHNAIQRIKQVTGATQVDTVAHSKGGFALRLYTSNVLGPGMQQPYAKSVRKAIFIGTPHRGLDYTFRHPSIHWALLPEDDDPVKYAPLAWTKALIYGKWVESDRVSFVGPFFKGQAQMLARWDQTYGLDKLQPDWYTTYHGGKGFVSESPGIASVIASAGNLVEKLKRSPVDPRIAVAVLAGSSASIPGILNEKSGPSDGIAFVKSAAAAEDLTAGGARLLDQTVMNLHHVALVANPKAMDWVSQQLAR